MKPEDLKLIELLQINEEAGTIYFNNRRMLIFDADAMGFLRRELIERLGVAGAQLRRKKSRSMVLGGSIIMLLSTVVVSGLNFGFNAVMARMLGPAMFGHVAVAKVPT